MMTPTAKAVVEEKKPAVFNFSLSRFLGGHPVLATAMLCLFCLWVGQEYYTMEPGYMAIVNQGQSGTIAPIYAVCGVAFALCMLWAWGAFVGAFDQGRLKTALYTAGGGGVIFLAGRLVWACSPGTVWYLAMLAACLLVGLITFLVVKNKNTAGISILALSLLLALVPVFGVGKPLYYFGALVAAAILLFKNGYKPKPTQIAAAALCIASAALASYMYGAGSTPVESLVNFGLILGGGMGIAAIIGGTDKVGGIVFTMFAIGFVMRLGYVVSITLPYNQHDVFPLSSPAPRHNSYIWHIFENWSLPEKDVYNAGLSQYYHPPLHHILSAVWMKLQTLIGIDKYAAYENVQYFTLFCSSAMMVVANKVLKEFKLKDYVRIVVFAIIAFHPTFYIFAGSVNNDCLCTLLLFGAVLYTVRWYKDQSYKNTLMLALTIGGAMMSKLSGAMVAVGTAYVILAVAFNFKTGFVNNVKRLWKKAIAFVAVCFPLGLWWPIRCYLKFGMPLSYVPSMTTEGNPQYVGGYTLWQRLTGSGALKLSNPYPNIGYTGFEGEAGVQAYDYGIGPYTVKSALFGEYFNAQSVSGEQNIYAYIMVFASLVIIAIGLCGMFSALWASFRRDREGALLENSFICQSLSVPVRFLCIYYAALVGSYVLFCFRYAFTCTMDFRYIVPSVLIGGVFAGMFVNGPKKWQNTVLTVLAVTAVLFCAASFGFYYASYIG